MSKQLWGKLFKLNKNLLLENNPRNPVISIEIWSFLYSENSWIKLFLEDSVLFCSLFRFNNPEDPIKNFFLLVFKTVAIFGKKIFRVKK